MANGFDLEDVVGVAVADFLKRLLALWSCLIIGVVLVATAALVMSFLLAAWTMISGGGWTVLDSPNAVELVLGILFGFLAPIFSSWGPVYGAFLIALTIYFFRADAPHPYVWGAAAGVVGAFFFLLTFEDFDLLWGSVTIVLWVVEMAGVFFFLKWWMVRSRVRAEQHLEAIAHQNRMKREAIRQRTGGAVGDREFAVGDGDKENGP